MAIQRGNQVLDKQIQPETDSSDQLWQRRRLAGPALDGHHLEATCPRLKRALRLGDQIIAINGNTGAFHLRRHPSPAGQRRQAGGRERAAPVSKRCTSP